MGTMQRWPCNHASRNAVPVDAKSDLAVTSLGARSLASDADLTQCGTSPHCAGTSTRVRSTGGVAAASSAALPSAGSAASGAAGAGADDAPRALPNLLLWLHRTNPFQTSNEKRMISITDEELRKYPIVFMHGRGTFRFSEKQRQALRQYFEKDQCQVLRQIGEKMTETLTQMTQIKPQKK